MIEIIGVRFRETGKIYNFSANGHDVKKGDNVIVETSRGLEFGTVISPNKESEDETGTRTLKPIVRIATEEDIEKNNNNLEKEKEVLNVFTKKVEEHKLPMKPTNIECAFDGTKILFFYTAENRVDFRELVKDLAGIYRTRIELRQIGVRDEAKMLSGIGICGLKFCCSSFLDDFQPVSIKMAKEQSLSLNPTKISGSCGRLMCCLKYEQDTYEQLIKETPRVGSRVETPEGSGIVGETNILTGVLKIKLDKDKDAPAIVMNKSDVKPIKNKKANTPSESENNNSKPKLDDIKPANSEASQKANSTKPHHNNTPKNNETKPNQGPKQKNGELKNQNKPKPNNKVKPFHNKPKAKASELKLNNNETKLKDNVIKPKNNGDR